jgi:hypothetical protein
MGQCLKRRIADMETIAREAKAWQESRNNKKAKINWRVTDQNVRIKLKRLYPTISN